MFIDNKVIEFNGMPLFQRVRLKAPFTIEGEILDFACFFYMVEGRMLSYDSRGEHTLNEKDAVIKNCNNYVQKYLASEESDEVEAIAIYLYPKLFQMIYKDEVPSFLTQNEVPIPKKLISNKLIEQYMMNLSIYFEDPDTLDEELGILKLKELMMILLKSENHANIRQYLSEIFAPVNLQFRQTIENNIFSPLTIEELAYLCNMSLSTFKREFKKAYHQTPARYIKHRRLSRAAQMLTSTDQQIGEIAFICGYHDVTTFSSVFNQKYGVSPSSYRLNQIGKPSH
ncbi:MAG: helix-turn-helix transcriptional regulator [Balneolaceae bacterium]